MSYDDDAEAERYHLARADQEERAQPGQSRRSLSTDEVHARYQESARVFARLCALLDCIDVIVVMQMYADEQVAKERAAVLKRIARPDRLEQAGYGRSVAMLELADDIREGMHHAE